MPARYLYRSVSAACLALVAATAASAPLWIDVRSPEEYAAQHLGSDPNIPYADIARRIAAIAPDKSTEIALYCAAGGRAGTATAQLQRLGYTNVRNAGGISQVGKERGCDATAQDDGSSIPCPAQGIR
jgi:phage shock protein E